jgi:hypothetical protein
MKIAKSIFIYSIALSLAVPAVAQMSDSDRRERVEVAWAEPDGAPVLKLAAESVSVGSLTPATIVLPRMAPELALQSFQAHAQVQNAGLAAYSATIVIDAQLPDTAQKGNFELVRQYTAPNALAFTPVRFTGDGFVKSNVITRLLQSEVQHVEKGDGAETAISAANYKFSYKGADAIDGREVHVFQVRPRRKVAGLFKGRIYVDAVTGTLRRVEGTVVKSPSFFIKKIEFVQDYADFGAFTFPVRAHSMAMTRVVGRAIVDIFHRDYQPQAVAGTEAAMGGSVLIPAGGN